MNGTFEPAAAAAVFAALGDATRVTLLEHLAREGDGTATSLTGITDISRQAVNRHLRVLEGAGLVGSHKSGREVIYSLKRESVRHSSDWLQRLGQEWEGQLELVREAAESD